MNSLDPYRILEKSRWIFKDFYEKQRTGWSYKKRMDELKFLLILGDEEDD